MADKVRIDKWLWAARFVKTRSLAAAAISGGRVHVNGVRAKPSKEVAAGDIVEITLGQGQWTVTVLRVSDRRGPATEAQLLYEESDESRERRMREAAQRRMAAPLGAELGARPTKRDRRRIEAFRERTRGEDD